MRRVVLPCLVLSLLAATVPAAPAPAQEAGDIAEVILVRPLTGHGPQFEEGAKSYFADVRAQNAPFAWFMWDIMTGENTGNYYVGTFQHAWSDFDQMPGDPEALQASFRENILPHMEGAEASFWRLRPELGNTASMEEAAPSAFSQIFWYKVKQGRANQVEAAFRTVAEAAASANWVGEWEVYQLVNGGETPLYVVSVGADSFADFAEPDPNLYEMLVGEMGEEAAQELFQGFSDAIEWEKSEAISFREDLSYTPPM